MLTTNQKGLLAETMIIRECINHRIGVSRPLDDMPYDLVLDLGNNLLRVQCKFAARVGDVVAIRTRRSRRGPNGHIHRSYDVGDIDAMAAFCPDTESCCLLPQELSVGRAIIHLRLSPTRNNQKLGVWWANDYEFGATISRAGR
jgi:hypothetical protein